MAYEGGSLDANLAAAAGYDPELVRELRAAFIESAERQIDLLARSRCDGNWQVAAMRLKGLAASFHADELQAAAEHALNSAPGEPFVIREIEAIRDKVPGFTGTISDLGGPTANMYRIGCKSAEIEAACRKPSCVYPGICPNLNTDHAPLIIDYDLPS